MTESHGVLELCSLVLFSWLGITSWSCCGAGFRGRGVELARPASSRLLLPIQIPGLPLARNTSFNGEWWLQKCWYHDWNESWHQVPTSLIDHKRLHHERKSISCWRHLHHRRHDNGSIIQLLCWGCLFVSVGTPGGGVDFYHRNCNPVIRHLYPESPPSGVPTVSFPDIVAQGVLFPPSCLYIRTRSTSYTCWRIESRPLSFF